MYKQASLWSGSSAVSVAENLAHLGKQLGASGIKLDEAAQLANIYKSTHVPGVMHTLGRAALAVPVAAAVLGLGGYAVNKLSELKRISGFQDPISNYAVRVGVHRAVGSDPELNALDPALLHDRGAMLYSAAPTLFEPENKEVLRNTLLRLKDMGGADANVLKEVSDYEKTVGAHHQKYQQYADIGNNMLGI